MAHKPGELNWTRHFSPEELAENRRAPYGTKAGIAFASVGAILSLLPPKGIVLDAGCADGWFTDILCRQGYDARGMDVCESEIEYAMKNRLGMFGVGDYDHLPTNIYHAIVFNETLHHSVDRRVTLASAFKALKPGGVLIASEPGLGHGLTAVARNWAKEQNVTERSCPPIAIAWAGYGIGFRDISVYPSLYTITSTVYTRGGHTRENGISKLIRKLPFKMTMFSAFKWLHGITVMHKPHVQERKSK